MKAKIQKDRFVDFDVRVYCYGYIIPVSAVFDLKARIVSSFKNYEKCDTAFLKTYIKATRLGKDGKPPKNKARMVSSNYHPSEGIVFAKMELADRFIPITDLIKAACHVAYVQGVHDISIDHKLVIEEVFTTYGEDCDG